MATERYVVEALDSRHPRASFESGIDALDRYLRQQAGQDSRNNIARCFVLLDPAAANIVGYYTLSAYGIAPGELPEEIVRKLPRYPLVPAILLGRLATDRRYRGQGHGRRLLISALSRALALSAELAAFAVVVDAKDEASRSFYERHGFLTFPQQHSRLFLPMRTIAQSLTAEQ